MKFKKFLFKTAFLVVTLIVLCSHNLYLKLDNYFLEINKEANISLFNGSFEKSENIITRDRMLDASIVANGKRNNIEAKNWKDQDSTITYLNYTPKTSGTHVVGVSTKARNIALTASKFNDYLKHDGIIDVLEHRKQNNLLENDAFESYEKHVKAIYQVGDATTDDYRTVLGYPIEFVPVENPYQKFSGDSLTLQLLLDNKPLANQIVYADYVKANGTKTHTHKHGETEHTHDDSSHTHEENQQLRTNNQGLVTIQLPEDGIYYVRTIHMVALADDSEHTHQSKWATLSFQVTHKHDETTHFHHENETDFPAWLFIVGSILVIVILFFVFRKK